MGAAIKFGTDGWRGIIARDFTFDNVRLCAQGVASYLQDAGIAHRGLVVGYDTRFASEHFATAAAEVAAANDIKTYLCPTATPTPVVSYGVRAKKTAGAIIITASHNPAIWNGFKFKSELGTSAAIEIIAEVEKHISRTHHQGIKRLPLNEALENGLIEYLDLAPAYFEQIARLVDLDDIRRTGLKVVVDPMYGAGAGYIKTLLSNGKTQVIEINQQRNPLFPGMQQPEPIAHNLTMLAETVTSRGADVGLATDGDADRIGIVDENGKFLTPLDVFPLLAYYMLEIRGERGAIVKTITTTNSLYRLGKLYDVPVYETPVGFKYVAPLVIKENALMGGEESGGYSFRNHVPDRDGILAGVCFLDLMVKTGKTPSQLLERLFSIVGPHYYQRADVEFSSADKERILQQLTDSKPGSINGVPVIRIDTEDGFRFVLKDDSWLLIRFSGTEPIMRIYAESDSQQRAEQLLSQGKRLGGI